MVPFSMAMWTTIESPGSYVKAPEAEARRAWVTSASPGLKTSLAIATCGRKMFTIKQQQ
jgi:hypothetical protein